MCTTIYTDQEPDLARVAAIKVGDSRAFHAMDDTLRPIRPSTAPTARRGGVSAPVDASRPRSALRRKLTNDLDRQHQRIARLNERLHVARAAQQARWAGSKLTRLPDERHLSPFDGWVLLDNERAVKLGEQEERLRLERRRYMHGRNGQVEAPSVGGVASVHDPSFARKGDQAVRDVYGRITPLRKAEAVAPASLWQHRQPNSRIMAILHGRAESRQEREAREHFQISTPSYRQAPQMASQSRLHADARRPAPRL
jgi:hypothetical protein